MLSRFGLFQYRPDEEQRGARAMSEPCPMPMSHHFLAELSQRRGKKSVFDRVEQLQFA